MQQVKLSSSEPIGELKFGQVGIANLKVRVLDPAGLNVELKQKAAAAPQLFDRTPLVVDLSQLRELPDLETTQALLTSIREAGLLPVGLSYGTSETEQLARRLNLPLFAKFRAAFERKANNVGADTNHDIVPPSKAEKENNSITESKTKLSDARASSTTTTASKTAASQHHAQPVRSGQQIYVRDRDLTLTAMVGHGAEVIADGSIHIYGRLSGRALAGAQGDTSARIYCQDFQAELISIAGQYRVFEEIPADLHGKSVQAWLEGEKLLLAKIF